MPDRDDDRRQTPKFSTFTSKKRAHNELEPDRSQPRNDRDHSESSRRHKSRVEQASCKPTSRSTRHRDERVRQDRPNPSVSGYRVTRSRSRSPVRLSPRREASPRRNHHGAAIDRYVPPKQRNRNPSPPTQDLVDFFVIDTKGDPDNLKYGGISKWKVPRYHLGGGGEVLGPDPSFKIDWAASTKDGYVLKRVSRSETRSLPVSDHEGVIDGVSPVEPMQKDSGADDDEEADLRNEDEVEQAFEGMGQEPTKPGLPIATPKG
nr:hypothetical protein B0A51_06692 [Rachicladosporium sp. CCFEE 5018]